MSMRSRELGAFLQSRRAEVRPGDVGLPAGRGRRVAGLRREEVAMMAAISPDYYARIEQGRRVGTPEVLDAICEVLQLDASARAYVLELAGLPVGEGADPGLDTVDEPRAVLYNTLADLTCPALILGYQLDVLAWNEQVTRLLIDFADIPYRLRNLAFLLFTDTRMRAAYRDWIHAARKSTAMLRLAATRHPDDERLTHLIGELSVRDANFRRWWAEHKIARVTTGFVRHHHATVGNFDLNWASLVVNGSADQHLVVTAPADAQSKVALSQLVWGARAGAIPVRYEH